jgi:hypothetical protein
MNHSKRGYTGAQSIHHLTLFSTMQQVKEVSNLLLSQKQYSENGVAQERLRIIQFYAEFGEKATKKAFSVDRKIVWVWKKRMKDGTLAALIPSSTRPKTTRRMTTDPALVSFIVSLRQEHPRLGKEKIKPLLDAHANMQGLRSISVSTIGKVIKRNNLYWQKTGRIYHNPASGHATRQKTKRIRIKRMAKQTQPGYLQMDTVVRFIDGLRVYLFSAIDVQCKFAFSFHYKQLNSQNMVDFFKKVTSVCPLPHYNHTN